MFGMCRCRTWRLLSKWRLGTQVTPVGLLTNSRGILSKRWRFWVCRDGRATTEL